MKPLYFAMALLLASSMAWTQENQPPPPDGTPDTPPGPGRGMARVSVMNGEVSVRRGDGGEVSAAAMNAPLGSGDTLLTGSAARAELQFDAASLMRVAANSEVRMGDLQYHHNQIQVALGLVTFTVLRNSQTENEVDTPNLAVHPKGQGAYRILVRDDGTTEITVRVGEADISTAQGSQVLKAGQTMMVRGSQDQAEFQIVNAAQQDDWDRWNAERDQELMRSTSTRYVNPDVYGAEDLDRNGRWVEDGSYGRVWTPNVSPDWAPYREGRWVWADGYGWTWVSTDPWGWAPYHYGRWYHAGFGWAWWPGPVVGPCYWSPALVGFFGFGGGGGFGFGFGNIGWVPLAPFERFHPWWGRGGFRNTVIVNNFNVYNGYRNARVAGGVTGVAAGNFGRGGARFSAVNGAQVRSAGLVRGSLPVTPNQSSMRFSDRSVNASSLRQSGNTQFFNRSSVGGARSTTGIQNSGAGGSHGWSRFGQPIHSGAGANAAPQSSQGWRTNGAAQNQGGWTRANGSTNVPNNASRSQVYNSPSSAGNSGRAYGSTSNAGANNVRINPPIVRERSGAGYGGSYGGGYNAPRNNTPAYSAPRNNTPAYNAPRYNAPRYNAPAYNAPAPSRGYSAPSRSYSAPAPRSYSAPAPRSAPSGGGGGNRGGGGGGGSHASGGGGGGGSHHR